MTMISHEVDNLISDIENHENLTPGSLRELDAAVHQFKEAADKEEDRCIMVLSRLIKKLNKNQTKS